MPSESLKKIQRWVPLFAAGTYIVFALVGIYVSSFMVIRYAEGEFVRQYEIVMGWVFVLASGLFFYTLIWLALKRQQAAAEALERSETHYRMLIDNMADLVAVSPTPGWNDLYYSSSFSPAGDLDP